MSAEPWSKFYWADWRSDPKLRMCSLGARGLWMELLSLMHASDEFGHLLVNGKSPSEQQLAILCGALVTDIRKLKHELEEAGVPGIREDGVWFSRRMLRDMEKRLRDKANGSKGGNPNVKGPVNAGVNPPENPLQEGSVKDGDKARGTRDPEARNQKLRTKEDPPYPPEFQKIWDAFPKQRIGNKAKSFAAYQSALTRSTHEEIYEGVIAYIDSDEVSRGFAKGFAAWLNDDRWKHTYSSKHKVSTKLDGSQSQCTFASEAERIASRFLEDSSQRSGQGETDASVGASV